MSGKLKTPSSAAIAHARVRSARKAPWLGAHTRVAERETNFKNQLRD